MFLTKKAEDAFNALLKQAKDILDGKKESKFKEIVDLIEQDELQKAVEDVLKLDRVTERVAFYDSDEFLALPEEKQRAFRNSVDSQDGVQLAIETGKDTADKTEEKETVSDEKNETEDQISDLFGDEKSTETKDTDVAGLEGADLNEVPTAGEESKKNASIFDYLHKKAEDFTQSAETTVEEYPLDEQVKSAVRYHIEEGKTKQDAIDSALAECNCVDDVHYKQVAEDAANTVAGMQPQDISAYTANVHAFLEKAANYKEEGNEFDRICELSRSSSTAYEFLNKVANKLDENTAKQYPGQKLFDDPKNVSFDGGFGTSPQHPGQKVLSTKEGGNATVETNFPKAEKPQVDVYTDKVNRGKVTTINSLDGTIAFMQPIPFEKQTMGEPADYTGFVTGTKLEQFGNPNAAGPVAGTAHKTEKYLDKVYELADKKEVVGKPHAAKASAKSMITKKAWSDEAPWVGKTPEEYYGYEYPDPKYREMTLVNDDGVVADIQYTIYIGTRDDYEGGWEYCTDDNVQDVSVSLSYNGKVIGSYTASLMGWSPDDEEGLQTELINRCSGDAWEKCKDKNIDDDLKDIIIDIDGDDFYYKKDSNEKEDHQSKDVKSNAGFNFYGVNKTATSKKAELKKKAIDAKQWIAEHEEANKLTEEEYKKAYESYLQSRENERKMLDARFPHSGNNSIPVDTYDEFKMWYGKPEKVSYQLDANKEDYARSNPEFAHEYVFNAVQSGADIKDLPTDIVDIARKWEKEHNGEYPIEESIFAEVPVVTPDDLPTRDINAGVTFSDIQTTAAKEQQISTKAGQSDMYVGGPAATTHGQSDMSNDSFVGAKIDQTGKHTLTDKEREEAHKRLEEQEKQIQRANGFLFHMRKTAMDENSPELQQLVDSVNVLQSKNPVSYQRIMDASKNSDAKTFETVLNQELMINKESNEPVSVAQISTEMAEALQKKLNPELKQQEIEPKEEKPSEKDKEKDNKAAKDSKGEEGKEEDPLAGLEDLLG